MSRLSAKGLIVVGACDGAELKSVRYERAVCFEPEPSNFSRLKRSASRLKGKMIKVFQVALSDETGEAEFHLTTSFYSHSLMKLAEPHKQAFPNVKQGNIIKVKVQTLDDMMESNELDPSLYETMWIDVQGAELKVLKGSANTLKTIKTIMCEVSDVPYYKGGATTVQVDEYLATFGFQRYDVGSLKASGHGYKLYERPEDHTEREIVIQNTNHGVPEDAVLALKIKLHLSAFIETGTYGGDSAMWAAENFDKVITIELSKSFHAAAQQKLSRFANVRCVLGSSPDKLPSILSEVGIEKCAMWLDAHWCGWNSEKDKTECPLMAELDAIASNPGMVGLVMIDDARLFVNPPPPPHKPVDWPKMKQVADRIESMGCVHRLVGDVIFVVDKSNKAVLDNLEG